MPNGGPDYSKEQWAQVLAYFEEKGKPLISLATAHNLFIEKYYHGGASWDLRFIHPKGGQASVTLHFDYSKQQSWVSSNWYIDVYEEFTRYLKWGERIQITEAQDLMSVIKTHIRAVLSWEKSSMTAHGGYKNPWGNYSKEEFERMTDHRVGKIKNVDAL
jgi:hypothetical protein